MKFLHYPEHAIAIHVRKEVRETLHLPAVCAVREHFLQMVDCANCAQLEESL